MKVKVHWVIDGIAEVEAESLEDAEKIILKVKEFIIYCFLQRRENQIRLSRMNILIPINKNLNLETFLH